MMASSIAGREGTEHGLGLCRDVGRVLPEDPAADHSIVHGGR